MAVEGRDQLFEDAPLQGTVKLVYKAGDRFFVAQVKAARKQLLQFVVVALTVLLQILTQSCFGGYFAIVRKVVVNHTRLEFGVVNIGDVESDLAFVLTLSPAHLVDGSPQVRFDAVA